MKKRWVRTTAKDDGSWEIMYCLGDSEKKAIGVRITVGYGIRPRHVAVMRIEDRCVTYLPEQELPIGVSGLALNTWMWSVARSEYGRLWN